MLIADCELTGTALRLSATGRLWTPLRELRPLPFATLQLFE